jgi:hypothetical protein
MATAGDQRQGRMSNRQRFYVWLHSFTRPQRRALIQEDELAERTVTGILFAIVVTGFLGMILAVTLAH